MCLLPESSSFTATPVLSLEVDLEEALSLSFRRHWRCRYNIPGIAPQRAAIWTMSHGVNVPFDLRDKYFLNRSTTAWPPGMDFSLVDKVESCQSAVLTDSDNAFTELIRESRKTNDK